MPEEGQGSKCGQAREEYQLKVFRHVTDNKKGHNHHRHRGSVVNVDRAYEVSGLWIEGQPATGTFSVHLDPANPRIKQAALPAVRTTQEKKRPESSRQSYDPHVNVALVRALWMKTTTAGWKAALPLRVLLAGQEGLATRE